MKILMLGEYSGFYKNLKVGFEKLGHEVFLIAGGDGWKKIDGADVQLDVGADGILRKPRMAFNYLRYLPLMKGYDFVLVINPSFFKKGVGSYVLDYIKKNNGPIYLSACGDDCEYIKFGLNGGFRWWPFMDWPGDCRSDYYQSNFEVSMHKKLMDCVTGVIPVAVDYQLAWESSDYSELLKPIVLLPIDVESIEYRFADEVEPVRFFHGVNRQNFKGTKFIRQAMLELKATYGTRVETVCDGGLPLNQYLELIANSHVMIDQCKAYSYSSMNSLYSMAQGKIVLGCLEPECLNLLGSKPPVFRIEPDSNQIYSAMDSIVNSGSELAALSALTRRYVEDIHDSKVIAEQYLDIFRQG